MWMIIIQLELVFDCLFNVIFLIVHKYSVQLASEDCDANNRKLFEGRLYKVNRTGPSTVPCGALYRKHSPFSWGNGNLFRRYDSKHCSTVPLILTKCSNVCSKILWSTVSNAALRSSRTNTEINQLSAGISRSFITFTSAVSALTRIC